MLMYGDLQTCMVKHGEVRKWGRGAAACLYMVMRGHLGSGSIGGDDDDDVWSPCMIYGLHACKRSLSLPRNRILHTPLSASPSHTQSSRGYVRQIVDPTNLNPNCIAHA